MDKINEIVHSLPPMLTGKEFSSALTVLPDYDDSIRDESNAVRLMALSDLERIYLPSQMTHEIYIKLYLSLIRSLQKKQTKLAIKQRYENNRAIQKQAYNGILGGSDSYTIIAPSGVGKSSAINRAVSLITENRMIKTQEPFSKIMESMFSQTVLTNDFVLVCDGPLNNDLDAVITEMQNAHSGVLHVVRLKKNMGLGNALNEGIKHCKNELVARMDSDDVSRLDRCEKQIQVFERMPELSIVSGTVQEFSVSIDRVEARRVLPETHNEIMAFVKKRNPFNQCH